MAKDGNMRTLSLRAIFLIGFVIAMPVLALPAVARRLDDWLYGPPPVEIAPAPLRRDLQHAIEPQMADRASPASFDVIDPALTRRLPHEGLDALSHSPPPLAPLPDFTPLAAASPPAELPLSPADETGPLDAAAAARLTHIRHELQRLGAEYIVLDTTEGTGDYRFHCQMRDGPPVPPNQSPQTRDFEATAADPLAAAERVLGEVSAWRIAARTPNTRTQ